MNIARQLIDADELDEGRQHLDNAIAALEDCNEADSWFTRNRVAWMLATSPKPQLRDGQIAITIATEACELTGFELATTLDTLAAAHAEVGDFDSAIKWSEKAVQSAPDVIKRERYAKRLEVFKEGKPWRNE